MNWGFVKEVKLIFCDAPHKACTKTVAEILTLVAFFVELSIVFELIMSMSKQKIRLE